jgi:hypothetical protein
LADHLDEAARQLGVELATRREVDAKLVVLWTSVVRVWDLVLDDADELTYLVASLSVVVELLEGRVDAAITNGVCWGIRSALVATLSYFPELDAELELVGSERNADLTAD